MWYMGWVWKYGPNSCHISYNICIILGRSLNNFVQRQQLILLNFLAWPLVIWKVSILRIVTLSKMEDRKPYFGIFHYFTSKRVQMYIVETRLRTKKMCRPNTYAKIGFQNIVPAILRVHHILEGLLKPMRTT